MSSIVIPAIKRPFINKTQAIALAGRLFGVLIPDEDRVRELDSYQDRNFYLQGTLANQENRRQGSPARGLLQEFTLKVTNHADSSTNGTVDAQSLAMMFLNEQSIGCPVPVTSIFGTSKVMCKVPMRESRRPLSQKEGSVKLCSRDNPSTFPDGIELFDGGEYDQDEYYICAVRLLSFLQGKLFHEVPQTDRLLFNFGQTLGKLDRTLKTFHHTKLEGRQNKWDLTFMPVVENFLEAIPDERKKRIVASVCRQFEDEVLANLADVDKQVIHGDVNLHNTVVSVDRAEANGRAGFAFIDFGDLTISYRLFEVAIAMMYIINMADSMTTEHILHAGKVLAGYHSVYPLSDQEAELLYVSIAARFCQALVFGAYSYKYLDPGNEYLLRSAKKGWDNLGKFLDTPKEKILEIWQHEMAKNEKHN